MVPVLFSYLLKLSVSLAMVYLFYRLVLQNLTFYHCNRWYLLAFTALSFLIPLVDVSDFWTGRQQAPLPAVTQYIPPVAAFAGTELIRPEASTPAFDAWDWLLLVLLSGIGVLLVKMGAQLFSFIRLRQRARLISDQRIKIYQVDADILPFSFGRSVFLNQALHRQQDLQEIIRHEFVHVQQGHTVDVVWIELVCMLNWYNPFAWLLRRHLRQNLEYIADSQVLQTGIDKKHYQYLLLQVTGDPAFHLAHSFNFTSLKKRIMMMNKMPSARPQLARFLFLLPLVAVLLLAFRGVEKPDGPPEQEIKNFFAANGYQDYQAGAGDNPPALRNQVNEINAANQESAPDQRQTKPQETQKKKATKEEQQAKEAAAQEKQIQQQAKEAAAQEKQIRQQAKEAAAQEKQIRQQAKEAAAQEKQIRQQANEVAAQEKQIRQQAKEAAAQEKQIRKQAKEAAAQEKQIRKQAKEVAAQEKQIRQQAKEAAAQERQIRQKPSSPAPPAAPQLPPTTPVPGDRQPLPPPPAAPKLPPPPPPKGDNMGAFDAKDSNRLPADYKAFLKRNPQVEKLIWYWDGSVVPVKPVQVVVIQKSGAQESYLYSSEPDMAGAEKKYGKLPWPAPPVARYDVPPGKIIAVPIDKPKGQE